MIFKAQCKCFYNALILLSFLLVVIFSGCADMDIPNPKEIIKEPLGKGSVQTGMTMDEVHSIYGDPDVKGYVTASGWNEKREEWVYTARYSALPVGAGYLSEDLYLYFDGDRVTNISREPLGERESGE